MKTKMQAILDGIWNFVKTEIQSSWKIGLFIIIAILLFEFSSLKNYNFCKPIDPPKPVNRGERANYSSDMNFLECLNRQHDCLYSNIEKENLPIFILENCGSRNYCGEIKNNKKGR